MTAVAPIPRAVYVVCLGATLPDTSTRGEVVSISTATNTAAAPIVVGSYDQGMVISPDSKTVYVLWYGGGEATTPAEASAISAATHKVSKTIDVAGSAGTAEIAVTPNGATLYAVIIPPAGNGDGKVIPISTATNTKGKAIQVGITPDAIAITP